MPGDHQTLTRLFLRHERMLREYIRGLVRSTADADDLFQEVGVCILNAAQPQTSEDSFGAWSRGVARNMVLHHWRNRRRSKVVVDTRLVDAVDLAYREADAQADAWDERRQALEDCVRGLPGRSRDVLRERYDGNRSFTELSRRTGKTETSLRMLVSRLRRELLSCVERRLASEG